MVDVLPDSKLVRAQTHARSPLTPAQQRRLDQGQRLLANITTPAIGERAARVGYNQAEHALGWSLWSRASGVDRPFHHFIVTAAGGLPDGGVAQRYRLLDLFENTWFGRTRNAIRRFVDPTQRDAVEAAFFQNLAQQPEGPLVVGSVGTYLVRLEGLRTSTIPGTQAAYQSLVAKGLTEQTLAEVRTLLNEARSQQEAPAPAPQAASEEELQAAALAQLEAYEQFNLWYIDWAETLRGALPTRDLIKLGLVRIKQNARNEQELEPDDGESAPDPTKEA